MSPDTFMEHVRHYCRWAESGTHNLEEVYPILLALMEGAPGLKTMTEFPPERTLPGLPGDVSWADTKRFKDLAFQCYPPVFWPYEMHPEGPLTDNIHGTLPIFSPNFSTDYDCWSERARCRPYDIGRALTSFIGGIMHPRLFGP